MGPGVCDAAESADDDGTAADADTADGSTEHSTSGNPAVELPGSGRYAARVGPRALSAGEKRLVLDALCNSVLAREDSTFCLPSSWSHRSAQWVEVGCILVPAFCVTPRRNRTVRKSVNKIQRARGHLRA